MGHCEAAARGVEGLNQSRAALAMQIPYQERIEPDGELLAAPVIPPQPRRMRASRSTTPR